MKRKDVIKMELLIELQNRTILKKNIDNKTDSCEIWTTNLRISRTMITLLFVLLDSMSDCILILTHITEFCINHIKNQFFCYADFQQKIVFSYVVNSSSVQREPPTNYEDVKGHELFYEHVNPRHISCTRQLMVL